MRRMIGVVLFGLGALSGLIAAAQWFRTMRHAAREVGFNHSVRIERTTGAFVSARQRGTAGAGRTRSYKFHAYA